MLSTLSLKFALTASLGIAPLMSGHGIGAIGSDYPGHYQVTEDVAREFGFSRPAQLMLADAVMDPDFYAWNEPAAHAQTANDAQGKVSETEAQAIKHLYAWLDDKVAKIEQNLQAGHTREALYWLGYGLHAVEDLAAHQGVTNAQHSYLSASGQNPDLRPAALTEAHDYARRFLFALWDKLGDSRWKLLLHEQSGLLSDREKDALIGHGWDLSIPALLVYKAMGELYQAQPEARRSKIHWDTLKVIQGYKP